MLSGKHLSSPCHQEGHSTTVHTRSTAAGHTLIHLTLTARHHPGTSHPECTVFCAAAGRDRQHHDDDDGQRRVHDGGPGEDPPGGEGEAPAHRESPATALVKHAVVMAEDRPWSCIHLLVAACAAALLLMMHSSGVG
jgi:hypothetical protein